MCFLLVVSPFHMASGIVLVLSSVSKHKKAMRCFWTNYVLDKYCLILSTSAVAHVFNISESKISIKKIF